MPARRRPGAHCLTAIVAILLTRQTLAQNWQSGPSIPGYSQRPYCIGVVWGRYYFSVPQLHCIGGMPFNADNDSPAEVLNIPGTTWGEASPLDNGPLLGRGAAVDGLN